MYTKIITLAPHGLTDKTAIKIRIYKFVSHFHFFFTVKKSTTQKTYLNLSVSCCEKKVVLLTVILQTSSHTTKCCTATNDHSSMDFFTLDACSGLKP